LRVYISPPTIWGGSVGVAGSLASRMGKGLN